MGHSVTAQVTGHEVGLAHDYQPWSLPFHQHSPLLIKTRGEERMTQKYSLAYRFTKSVVLKLCYTMDHPGSL